MTITAKTRRWFLRHVRRHDGEICDRCGRRCAIGGTYWFAPNWLWNKVEPSTVPMRCAACFTDDCRAAGLPIGWTCGPVGYVEDWNDLSRPRSEMVASTATEKS